ncbi:hypothetical protein DRY87_25460, partial [Salmonella enterica subsp. enterica serovar Newport]|nr:hypothetical protein [Salmonella enterica subsp. enterica serovar Newport]
FVPESRTGLRIESWVFPLLLSRPLAGILARRMLAEELGSGLIDQSQKMTAAAMQMAEKKVWAHRS